MQQMFLRKSPKLSWHTKTISITWKYTICYALAMELILNRKCYPTSDTTPISWEETPDKP